MLWMYGLGGATKTDELSEKFQTAFDPPPYAIFFGKRWNKPCFKIQNLQRLLDWKWPSQSSPPPFGTFPKIHKRVTSPFPFLYSNSNSNSMKFFLEQNLLQKKSISFLEADSEFDEAWLLRGCAFCSKPLFWIKRIRLVCFSVIRQNFYFKKLCSAWRDRNGNP